MELEPPADFSLDLVVMIGEGARSEPSPSEVRCVVFADGSLRFGEEGGGAETLPGLTRILTREQMNELWSLTRTLGLAEIELAQPAVNLALIEPGPGEVAFLLEVTGDGKRWSHVDVLDVMADDPPPVYRLARTLAELAWFDDQPPPVRRAAVRRYDFGPDPYARYRDGAIE